MPLVSIVIATHNYAHFLTEAVASVQAQIFTDWECIVVDDASTDATPQVVQKMMRNDPRIRYIRNDRNLGEGGSRNVGNKAAVGDYIASLDADDWWHPQKLQMQIGAIKQATPSPIVCFTAATVIGQDYSKPFECKELWLKDITYALRRENTIHHSSVVVSRKAILEIGGYNETLPFALDWEIWLRFLYHFNNRAFLYLPTPLSFYRIHDTNMSHRWKQNSLGERSVVRMILLHRGWGLRKPLAARTVIDEQLSRDVRRFSEAGLWQLALRTAAVRIAVSPARRWRWQYAAKIFRESLLHGHGWRRTL